MKSINIAKYIIFTSIIMLCLVSGVLFAEEANEEAIDPIKAAEAEVLSRLNLARSSPWAEAERLGLDLELLRREIVPVEVAMDWDQGLWPLAPSERLNAVARAHCEDMLQRGFFSHITPEGLTPEDRVISAGHNATIVKEELAALAFNTFVDPLEAAQMFMDRLLIDSFNQSGNEEEPALLHKKVVEAGVAFSGGELIVGGEKVHAYVLCILLVRPEGPGEETWVQCGRLFDDMNYNGICDSGEELAGMEMSVSNKEVLGVTEARGRYCIQRPLERWVLQVGDRLLAHNACLCDVWINEGILCRDYNYRTFEPKR
jgi:hypothetical protein